MSERRLEREHIEADPMVTRGEIGLTVKVLEAEKNDPETMPRRREFLDRRIGHLVFEYWCRGNEVKQLERQFEESV